MRIGTVGIGVSVILVCACSSVRAGQLGPPTGAVVPTMKSLDTIEPRIPVGPTTTPGDASAVYVISTPGSYYLTGAVVGVSGKSGIRIDASGVTLDLRGFEVRGVTGAAHGIVAGSGENLCVRNGLVLGWPGQGVDLSQAPGSRVESITAGSNVGDGIFVGAESTVRDCVARQNGFEGFDVNGRASFVHCLASTNGGDGFNGFGTYADCESEYNSNTGFTVFSGTLSHCYALSNGNSGFLVDQVSLDGCAAQSNTDGFTMYAAASLSHCVSNANSTDGFHLGAAALLDSCTSQGNGDDGFQLAQGATVTGCLSEGNHYGFYDPSAESDAHIDSCTAHANMFDGFLIDGAGTLIVRSEARANGNTDFIFVGTVQSGPVVSAQGTIASTNPWANFGSTVAALASVSSDPRIAAKEDAARQEIEARAKAPAPEVEPQP